MCILGAQTVFISVTVVYVNVVRRLHFVSTHLFLHTCTVLCVTNFSVSVL